MNNLEKQLLAEISDLHEIPSGAFSFRVNGKSQIINSTDEIIITKKTDKAGIDITVKADTKNKSMHIPVIISESGIKETVFNDFFIKDNSEILIVAGCGIHNNGKENSEHNGMHTFHIGKNCKVKYVEKHLGVGKNNKKDLSPTTSVLLSNNSTFEMETTQIGGVNNANRKTVASIGKNSKLLIKEKVLTTENEKTNSAFEISLDGENSSAEIISRVVAKDNSVQTFSSNLIGKNACFGRVECDGIILDNARIYSSPAISAENVNASLSHEAQIGKIASEQLIKLMTLGLTDKQAEEKIIEGYLKN